MTESRRAPSRASQPPRSPLGVLKARLDKALTVPNRAGLGYTLVNVLIVGFFAMAAVGVYEAWATNDAFALVQPVVSAGLVVWAWQSKRRRRPNPVPILLFAASMATLYLVLVSAIGAPGDAARMSPMVVLATSGALAMVAGAERPVWVGTYVTSLAVIGVIAVSDSMGFGPGIIVAEVLTTVVAMTVAHYVIRSVWDAYVFGSSRLSGLMEAAPVAVLEADLTNFVKPGSARVQLIREMNPRGFRLLEIAPGDVQAITVDLVPPEILELIDEVITSDRLTGESIMVIGDRSLLVSWKAFSRRFDRVLFSGVDITAQRDAEAALVEQIESRDRFIATISHELRTPLTGVLGLLELVASGEVEPGETDEMIHMALSQTHDMADIVQDLLVAARAANGALSINLEEMDLTRTVANVMSSIGDPFEVDTGGSIPAMADPVRVRQIVRNLVTNAIRYGGPHRRLIITNDAIYATIEVRDDGPALPEEFQQKMFEPYERSSATELPTDSVGLGLTVARTLARLMHGDLDYHHTGRESVFTLSLPRATVSNVA